MYYKFNVSFFLKILYFLLGKAKEFLLAKWKKKYLKTNHMSNSDCQTFLEQKFQELISFEAINNYYALANDFINSLLEKYRESAGHDEKCPFSCIYGVTMSGCVQKQLVIPNVSCGYIVFLHHLKKKHWKGLEYHIAIAWTFSKRQYCEFHYTQRNVHVYPFSSEQLKIAVNDLMDEAPIHQLHIKKASKQWKRFFWKRT
ncbi:hypothetical protein RFI_26331 [Reticulomyxa filosa]|uniref:Uncharacterized protein n=1 Tax=Reticulomyxa filosa TaxID=46433 RepID=X6MDC3_RETFI|nr:hypothetical protein RFI_26331 [Reticulomyxa filosa]|eukprot:ETO11045.1 hypothetical protein RFI_26331 [Reticulomyxa filosa]